MLLDNKMPEKFWNYDDFTLNLHDGVYIKHKTETL